MKKIFTLLFCVVAMGFAANASDFPMVDRCINALLGITDMETLKKAASLHIPRGTEEINLKALAEGVKLASAVPGEGNAPAARSEKKKGAKQ